MSTKDGSLLELFGDESVPAHEFALDYLRRKQALATTPDKYIVEVYIDHDRLVPAASFVTYGSWQIEGDDFLIVWDITGIRHAHRIEADVVHIRTVLAVDKNEEDDDKLPLDEPEEEEANVVPDSKA